MTKQKEVIEIDGPAHLLEKVPQLLGFYPEKSLVIVALKGQADQVLVTMSIDLPENLIDLDANFIINFKETIKRTGADGLVAILYIPKSAKNYQKIADLFMERISETFHIRDILWVKKDKWASFLCADINCCPIEGRTLEMNENITTSSKSEVAKYLSVGKTDNDLTPLLSQIAKQKAKALRNKNYEQWAKSQFIFLSQQKAFRDYDPKMWARLLIGLTDIPVRDGLLAHHIEMSQISEEPSAYLKQVALSWAQVARVAPKNFRAPICTCIGAFMWQAGEGVLARSAVDFALAEDIQFNLAKLLNNALDSGMPPWEFRDSFTKISNPWS